MVIKINILVVNVLVVVNYHPSGTIVYKTKQAEIVGLCKNTSLVSKTNSKARC